MSKKKEYKINLISLAFSGLSLALAIWAFVWSCDTQNDLEETNYKLALVEHRPRIRLFNPKLVGLDLLFDSTKHTSPTQRDTIDISSKLRLKLRLNFINIGNKEAKILGYVITDTITDMQVIKDYIKRGKKQIASTDSIFTKHRFHEVSVYDTSDISFTHTLRFINNNRFVIHFVIYYENELGQQYDTYYWLTGKLNEFGFGQTLDPKTRKPVFIIDEKAFWRIVEFTDENNFSDVYSMDDQETSMNYLKDLTNQ